MINLGATSFGNGGVWIDKINDFDFVLIKKEVEKIKKNFLEAIDARPTLIGQLKKTFQLQDCKPIIERLMLKFAYEHDKNFNHIKHSLDVFTLTERNNYKLLLNSVWINFQEKYEFQPLHDHTGVYSFIIFYDIPFDFPTEFSNGPGKNSTQPMNGILEFFYTDYSGQINSMHIYADRRYNQHCIIFPAKLKHIVNPFFSSDDYRITIAGNLSFVYDVKI